MSAENFCAAALVAKKVQFFSKTGLTKAVFVGIIAHVERLTPQDANKILGICIVVVR